MEWNKLSTEILVADTVGPGMEQVEYCKMFAADTVGPHVGRDPKSTHKQLVWFLLLLLLWRVKVAAPCVPMKCTRLLRLNHRHHFRFTSP